MHKFRNRRGLDLDFRCPCVLGTCSLNMSIKHQKELEKLTLLYNLAQNSIFSLKLFGKDVHLKKKMSLCTSPIKSELVGVQSPDLDFRHP